MCAAVADYRPAAAVAGKIEKAATPALVLELEATTDVLAMLSQRRREGQTLVGFAAEHGDGALERARAKLERKRLDAIVLNDVGEEGIGFDAPDNAVTIITADGEQRVGPVDKRKVADAVLDAVEGLRA
jgi:phosphopantothenoylcysteine decarboxylase/phosphopantothenate--cysteine ligase